MQISLLKRPVPVLSEVEDYIDAPLSESLMVALEDLMDVEVVQDIEFEEIQEQADPVPSTSTAEPSSSTGLVSKSRTLLANRIFFSD